MVSDKTTITQWVQQLKAYEYFTLQTSNNKQQTHFTSWITGNSVAYELIAVIRSH
jgi:hypothetical protein